MTSKNKPIYSILIGFKQTINEQYFYNQSVSSIEH